MSRRAAGWALVGLGALMLVAGIAGLLSSPTPPELQAADTTTPTSAATEVATTQPPTTTTTVAVTTTTASVATTSIAATTTIPSETVEEFVELFNAAVEADDEEFLFERLHPVVIETHGEELCRSWIAGEIIELSDYRLTGEPVGPEPRTVETPEGEREIDLISAPVAFTFQGQSFDGSAGFSVIDGQVHWVGECR